MRPGNLIGSFHGSVPHQGRQVSPAAKRKEPADGDAVECVHGRNQRRDSHLRIGERHFVLRTNDVALHGNPRFVDEIRRKARRELQNRVLRHEPDLRRIARQALANRRSRRGTIHRGVGLVPAVRPSARQSILIVEHVIEVADSLMFRVGCGNAEGDVLIRSRRRAGNVIRAVRIFQLQEDSGPRD